MLTVHEGLVCQSGPGTFPLLWCCSEMLFPEKRKKITAFFQNLLLYACRARAGAGTQDEGSVQPRFALVMLVTMHLREPASW